MRPRVKAKAKSLCPYDFKQWQQKRPFSGLACGRPHILSNQPHPLFQAMLTTTLIQEKNTIVFSVVTVHFTGGGVWWIFFVKCSLRYYSNATSHMYQKPCVIIIKNTIKPLKAQCVIVTGMYWHKI